MIFPLDNRYFITDFDVTEKKMRKNHLKQNKNFNKREKHFP